MDEREERPAPTQLISPWLLLACIAVFHVGLWQYPKVMQLRWRAHPQTYCSKSGNSIPLYDKLGLTRIACEELCSNSSACNMYTFGRWEGFSVHYGSLHCQLYESCSKKASSSMTLYVKEARATADGR